MANPLHHAISSARRYGGEPEQYRAIHEWFDEPKAWFADFRQRAIRHHSEGIALAVTLFDDIVVDLGDGRTRTVPVRFIAEQHVREDLGRIPTAADWLRCMRPEPWMTRNARRLSRELGAQEPSGLTAASFWSGEQVA